MKRKTPTTETPEAFLEGEQAQALLTLTNDQFSYWGEELEKATDAAINRGDYMDYWFILSLLARSPNFSLEKKALYSCHPVLGEHVMRRYVARAERLGLIQSVKSKGAAREELTAGGKQALASTLSRWITEFGTIHDKYSKKK